MSPEKNCYGQCLDLLCDFFVGMGLPQNKFNFQNEDDLMVAGSVLKSNPQAKN